MNVSGLKGLALLIVSSIIVSVLIAYGYCSIATCYPGYERIAGEIMQTLFAATFVLWIYFRNKEK